MIFLRYETGYDSPLGPMALVSDGEALTELKFGKSLHSSFIPLWKEVFHGLDLYFSGEIPPSLPLNPQGTDFQKRVWALLCQIPYGSTVTYGGLAKKLGPGMSPQAVGRAVGKNPIAILIPCHRVVGKTGLTGYAWGLEKKQYLLDLEQKKIGAD